MSEVIKTSKRFFDNDIAEKSDQLDAMRKSKNYKAIVKASAGNEMMLVDIFFQHMLGDGEMFNPYELKANIDKGQLEYQRLVNGEWIADDEQVPVGRMITKQMLEDILYGHNRTDKKGNFRDSVQLGDNVSLGQLNKAKNKKRSNLQGQSSHSEKSIDHDLLRYKHNKATTDKAREFHLTLEALYLEQTGEVYKTWDQKGSNVEVKQASPDIEAQVEAEIMKLMDGLGNTPSDKATAILDINPVKK
tara:strand:+ start:148 stop:885 length:738 start_codon:yes stop_codon:yes gene_type:complete